MTRLNNMCEAKQEVLLISGDVPNKGLFQPGSQPTILPMYTIVDLLKIDLFDTETSQDDTKSTI